jgi:hypothetical protein
MSKQASNPWSATLDAAVELAVEKLQTKGVKVTKRMRDLLEVGVSCGIHQLVIEAEAHSKGISLAE